MLRIIILILFSGILYSEQYSIISDSVTRTFSAYFPEDTSDQAPNDNYYAWFRWK